MRLFLTLLFIGICTVSYAQTTVDKRIVLALDISGSMDTDEYNLMIDGYEAAVTDSSIIALVDTFNAGITITVTMWANNQQVVISERLIQDASDMETLASDIGNLERVDSAIIGTQTGLGNAINHAVALLDIQATYDSLINIIDVSGDGTRSVGADPDLARDAAEAKGYTVNGLPILTNIATLDDYYQDNVVTSDGFLVSADSYEAFSDAITTKLTAELTVEEQGSTTCNAKFGNCEFGQGGFNSMPFGLGQFSAGVVSVSASASAFSGYLLKEDGDTLLLEDGGRILIE